LFDSAERAVFAGAQLAESVRQLDISIRAAVHAGEIEPTLDDVRGVVVHAAARMMALGQPGDVIVSATIREIVDGSEVALEDFGARELRGLGKRQLYRLARQPGRHPPMPASAH